MKRKNLSRLFGITIIICVIFSCSKITGENNTTEKLSYKVTKGACGEVIFEETIGTDSISAIETIKQRKIEFFGHSNFMIKSTHLEVEKENGNIPEKEFYALHVLDEDSLHLHSVSEVITDEGALYDLRRCPD